MTTRPSSPSLSTSDYPTSKRKSGSAPRILRVLHGRRSCIAGTSGRSGSLSLTAVVPATLNYLNNVSKEQASYWAAETRKRGSVSTARFKFPVMPRPTPSTWAHVGGMHKWSLELCLVDSTRGGVDKYDSMMDHTDQNPQAHIYQEIARIMASSMADAKVDVTPKHNEKAISHFRLKTVSTRRNTSILSNGNNVFIRFAGLQVEGWFRWQSDLCLPI